MQEGIYHDNFEGHKCPGCVNLRARLAEVEAQRDGLKKLVMAVSVKYPHIDTSDVDGKNWFDARDEALAKLEAHNGK